MQTLLLCMCTSPPAKAWFLKTPPPRQLQRNSPHYTPVSPAPLQNKAWIAADLLKNPTCFNQKPQKPPEHRKFLCLHRCGNIHYRVKFDAVKERTNVWTNWCQRFYSDSLCFVQWSNLILECVDKKVTTVWLKYSIFSFFLAKYRFNLSTHFNIFY